MIVCRDKRTSITFPRENAGIFWRLWISAASFWYYKVSWVAAKTPRCELPGCLHGKYFLLYLPVLPPSASSITYTTNTWHAHCSPHYRNNCLTTAVEYLSSWYFHSNILCSLTAWLAGGINSKIKHKTWGFGKSTSSTCRNSVEKSLDWKKKEFYEIMSSPDIKPIVIIS